MNPEELAAALLAVVTPLAANEVDELIEALIKARVEAIAVALLFSFLNPEHEQRLGARLRPLEQAGIQGPPVREEWLELAAYHTPQQHGA